jgi:hypothetical protein
MPAIHRFEDEAKRTYGANHESVCALARHPFEIVPTSFLDYTHRFEFWSNSGTAIHRVRDSIPEVRQQAASTIHFPSFAVLRQFELASG